MKRFLKWSLAVFGVLVFVFFAMVAGAVIFGDTPTPEPAAIVQSTNAVVPRPTTTREPTDTPTPVPTRDVLASRTPRTVITPRPTNTTRPIATSLPRPTSTPIPAATAPPLPTATRLPLPTATPIPLPTATTALPTAAIAAPAAIGETGQVTNIVDGDTIDVAINGAVYRVRYIGMDTPEVGVICAREATNANATLVSGRTVRLVRDVSETDRFGRLLRYVYVGDTFVNGALVAAGWAVARDYPPDTAMSGVLHSLQAGAASVGCNVIAQPTAVPDRGIVVPVGNCDPSYPTVCIPPAPPDLDCGDIPHRRFTVLAPDPHNFDGNDNDGIGCES